MNAAIETLARVGDRNHVALGELTEHYTNGFDTYGRMSEDERLKFWEAVTQPFIIEENAISLWQTCIQIGIGELVKRAQELRNVGTSVSDDRFSASAECPGACAGTD